MLGAEKNSSSKVGGRLILTPSSRPRYPKKGDERKWVGEPKMGMRGRDKGKR